MASENFRAKDISLRTQKKLLSRMSSKTAIKLFIDDGSAAILDNTYKLFKQYSGNKKEAEKLIKHVIKTIIKIGILHRNGQFDHKELEIASKFKLQFQKVIHTVSIYYELQFSYDYNHLSKLLDDLRQSLLFLVQKHLTDKSLSRINHVFQFCNAKQFLDEIFREDSSCRETMDVIVSDLNKMWET